MICPNCEHDNPEGRRYCEECGEKLVDIAEMRERARRRSRREAARFRLEAEKKGLDAEEAERIQRRRARRRAPRWAGPVVLVGVVALVVAVVLVAVALSDRKSEPERAVLAFYQALANRDFEQYLKYTEPELYKMAKEGTYTKEDHDFEYFIYDRYEVEGLKTELVREEGDVAEVRLVGGILRGWKDMGNTTNVVDFSVTPRSIELVKLEGTWTIPYYMLASEPTNIDVIPTEPEYPEVEEGAQEPS